MPWDETDDPFRLVKARLKGALRVALQDQMWSRFVLRLRALLDPAELVDASPAIGAVRRVKQPEEVDRLRATAAAADTAMLAITAERLSGRTEAEVSRRINELLLAAGHDTADFAIVGSGPNSASPHHEPGERVIEAGDAVVLDIGGTRAAYCSDTTRTAFVGEPKEGWGWSARCQVFDTRSADGTSKVSGDLRLGLAYRPLYTRWIIHRLDFLYDRQQGGTTVTSATTGTTAASFNTDNRRIVNNLSANFKPDGKTQISLQYGAKYVLETIDGTDYSGYTDLVGIEGRYDLTKKWDLGLRGSVLHSWSAGQFNYSSGPSVGYNVVKNAWISLGYNVVGFKDKDFSAADYTAQGPFVRFRFKFDQNSVREAVNWISHE